MPDTPQGFPDDRRAEVLVREYPTAVVPDNRKELHSKPPLFLVRVPGDAQAHRDGVRRVVEALRQSIDPNGRRAPYAHLPAVPDDSELLLSEYAGTTLLAPEHMTPDRFPHFQVVRDLVTYIREHPDRWPGTRARDLREYVCDQQQAEQRGLLGVLPRTSPPAGGLKDWVMVVGYLWLVRFLPRRLWARWTSWQVMRWLGELPVAAGGRRLFPVMDQIAAVQAARLRHDAHHEEALQELEELLTRALLADLSRPKPGGLLPKRRRRRARPVLLVELPPAGAPGARAAERFLRALHRMLAFAQPPGPLVIAVGQPSPDLLHDLGDPPESDFSQFRARLAQNDGTPVLVTLGAAALTGPGLDIRPVAQRTFRLSWRTTTSFGACVLALVLVGGALTAWRTLGRDDTCVGGNDSVAKPARPVPVHVKEWYEAARAAIDQENERAERFAAEGRTVRTVVAFGSNTPHDETDALFDGTIPELRGIALWQKRLNDEAVSDDARVPLRVEVRPTGEGFAHAERAARQLVAETRGAGAAGRKDYERVVGVLGYAQSRDETKAALHVLGQAGIPAIGTTATADEMLDGAARRSYWPLTPSNSSEARIEAAFASRQNIVVRRDAPQGCSPAERAIVIESSSDLYSRSLADKFRAAFPGPTQVFNFNQDGNFAHAPAGVVSTASADELADQLCRALGTEPDSVVYWSARARDFTAFINAVDVQGTCISHDVTVLGGNELTNVAMTGAYSNKDWLRLYYSAHRMPVTDENASSKTRKFVGDYDRFVSSTTHGTDPWRQDGHSAVAYDAFHVLSQAVDRARLRDTSAARSSVLVALGDGVTFDGATGWVAYDKGGNAPPVDKTLVLLRQLAKQSKVVAACGAYRPGASSADEGSPCTG